MRPSPDQGAQVDALHDFTGDFPMTHSPQLALLFPGQGSQKPGMLADLAEQFAVIGQTFDDASDALSSDLWAISQSGERLDETAWTQPVLLTASVALWRLWQQQNGTRPAILAGHSLGEYSALVAAGALTLTDAVRLVQRRGQLMQQAVPAGQGAMAAILGLDDQQVTDLCDHASREHHCIVQAANFNAAGQVVIAGEVAGVQAVHQAAKVAGGKALPLPVSVPSHCSLMRQAADAFADALAAVPLQFPQIPVLHNVNAAPAKDTSELRDLLIRQLYSPVLWRQTTDALLLHGIRQVVECGPGQVLSNLAKRVTGIDQTLPLDTPARLQQALEATRHVPANTLEEPAQEPSHD